MSKLLKHTVITEVDTKLIRDGTRGVAADVSSEPPRTDDTGARIEEERNEL